MEHLLQPRLKFQFFRLCCGDAVFALNLLTCSCICRHKEKDCTIEKNTPLLQQEDFHTEPFRMKKKFLHSQGGTFHFKFTFLTCPVCIFFDNCSLWVFSNG